MTEAQLGREIYGQIQMAKYDRGMTSEELASLIGMSPATLANMSSKRELARLDIGTVAKILKLNHKRLEFVDK